MLPQLGDLVHVYEQVAVQHAVGERQKGLFIGVGGEDRREDGAKLEQRRGPTGGTREKRAQDAEEGKIGAFVGCWAAAFHSAGEERGENLLHESTEGNCQAAGVFTQGDGGRG